MKTIYRIAKSELHSLFYSPIAWLVLVLFTFQLSMAFTERVIWELRSIVLGNRPTTDLTAYFLISGFGTPLFTAVLSYLYIYIPLLTMGLMSREYGSGSIKLLYSSPITSTQIILGKFFSMMLYGLIMIGIIAVYVVFYACVIKDMDYSIPVTGLIGIYLIICLYSAVGLFISCLTSYQVVAAIGTFAVLGVLNVLPGALQGVDFWRDITWWLGTGTHGAIAGLVSSEDVLYYLLMTFLFIALSVMKLRFSKQSKPWYVKAAKYCALVVAVVAAGYVTSRRGNLLVTDFSRNEQLTLTPKSREIVERFKDDKLTLTTYVNILDAHMSAKTLPKSRNADIRVFSKYYRFMPDMEFKYVYYYNNMADGHGHYDGANLEEEARKVAKSEGLDFDDILSPEEIAETIDLSGEKYRVTRVLEDSEGNKTFLRMFDDLFPYPGEQEISVALLRMKEGPVKLGFLTGHGERSIRGSGERDLGGIFNGVGNRHSLINQGYEPVEVPLGDGDRIPDDIDILVVPDIAEPLSPQSLDELRRYIAEGRNLIVTTDVNRSEVANPLLAEFGVETVPGALVQVQPDYAPTNVYARFSPEATRIDQTLGNWSANGFPLSLSASSALQLVADKGFQVTPLAYSPQGAWLERESLDFSGDPPVFNPQAGETDNPLPVALALTRQVNGKEQRVMIFGDTDWMSLGEITRTRYFGVANNSLTTLMCQWTAYYEYPVYFPRPVQPDDKIYLDYGDRRWLNWSFLVVFPALILIAYLFIWCKRRGK